MVSLTHNVTKSKDLCNNDSDPISGDILNEEQDIITIFPPLDVNKITSSVKGNCYDRGQFLEYLKKQNSYIDEERPGEGTWEIFESEGPQGHEEVPEPDENLPVFREPLFGIYFGGNPIGTIEEGKYFLLVPYKNTFVVSDYESRETFTIKYQHLHILVNATKEVENDLRNNKEITINTFRNYIQIVPLIVYDEPDGQSDTSEEPEETFEERSDNSEEPEGPEEKFDESNSQINEQSTSPPEERRSRSPRRDRFSSRENVPSRPQRQRSPIRQRSPSVTSQSQRSRDSTSQSQRSRDSVSNSSYSYDSLEDYIESLINGNGVSFNKNLNRKILNLMSDEQLKTVIRNNHVSQNRLENYSRKHLLEILFDWVDEELR